jgi:steroid 5-alpha reductase family enzyme
VWVIVNVYPSMRLWQNVVTHEFDWRDVVGYPLWTAAFIVQTTADFQKLIFKMDSANDGKFITHGLWRYVRHPNYTGEIVMWMSLWLTASSGFIYWSVGTWHCSSEHTFRMQV